MMLLLCALIVGSGMSWAEGTTYSMTIDSSNNGSNNVHWTSSSTTSLTYNNVTWSTSVTGTTSVTASKTYAQIGSKSNPATQVTISTTAFAGKKITAASLTGYCSSNTGPTLTITAGSTTILNSASLVKTTSTTYSANASLPVTLGNSDALTFTINSSANAAICISQISVTYEEGSSDPVAVTSVSLNKNTTNIKVGKNETLTATITPSNATNKNVSWGSDDESVATVENGVVTAVAEGVATITVTTEDGSKTASCEVTVIDSDPLPFSQDFTSSLDDWTQSGTDWTQSSSYGAVINATSTGTYDLVSPVIKLDANREIHVTMNHAGRYLNEAFQDECKLMIKIQGGEWEEVPVTTWFTNTNWTYVDAEMVLDSKFAGKKVQFALRYAPATAPGSNAKWEVKTFAVTAEKLTPTFTFGEESYTVGIGGDLTVSASSNSDGAITYASSNTTIAEINAATGVVTAKAEGEITITATIAETEGYQAKSIDVTLTVTDNRPTATLTFSPTELVDMEVGDDDQALTLETNFDGTITAVSGNDAIATITANGANSWIIHAVSKGDVTFTFSADATASYKAVNTTLNMTVLSSEKITLTKKLTFTPSSCGLVSGGYTANDSKTTLKGTFDGDSETTEFDGFTFKDTYINSSSIQMKASSGKITFPAIISENGFDVSVTYLTNSATVKIDNNEATGTDETSASLVIETGSKYCQISSIVLTPRSATETVAITTAKYATYVPTMKVAVPTGVTAYTISAATATSATLSPVTVIPANEPVIIYKDVNADTEVTFTASDEDSDVAGTNQLKYSATDITADGSQYVLALVNDVVGFHKVTAGTTIAAGKAYLVSPTGANFLRFDFEGTTGINDNKRETITNNREFYNLAGQRVAAPAKGLYIVNGKKVVVK